MIPTQQVKRFVWDEFPEDWPNVEFRLIYEGPLKAASSGRGGTRVPEKHAIRKQLHRQLKYLWNANPQLVMRTRDYTTLNPGNATWDQNQRITSRTTATSDIHQSLLKTLGTNFDRCGYKFVPLVSKHMKLSCGLDILFLRRDMPDVPLVASGGDIDNRLKVLLDALRIPSDCSELPSGITKDQDEEPYFFCLLEDDKLITDLAITTDNLLRPEVDESYVHLVIKVKIRPTDFSFDNLAFVP